jgi:hypothetical protein
MLEYEKNKRVLSRSVEVRTSHKSEAPVLLGEEYDEQNMTNYKTFRVLKNIYKGKSDGKLTIKEYSHTVITEERYGSPLHSYELQLRDKINLLKSIEDEVSRLNIGDYKTKESIMKFACDNGKSNGEKRKRSIILQKHLQDIGYRVRITTKDISSYS